MDPFIGQIQLFGFNFAPRGWALCDGQLLTITQNSALFALLGTTYGGDGRTTFALPDLRGRVPVGTGTGPGLTNYPLGAKSGTENITLSVLNLPPHNHTLKATADKGTVQSPAGRVLANTDVFDNDWGVSQNLVDTNIDSIGTTGGGQAFSIVQPSLALNYCIALQGIFPSRS